MDKKKNQKNPFLEELISFIQNKGFIWGPFPELYGGFSGFYTYGPLGKLLKNRVENNLRRVFQEHQFWELESPIVLPDIVWKASGHLDTFVDKAISCEKCKATFRVDKLIEEQYDVCADSFSDQQLLTFIQEHHMKCPTCGGDFIYDIDRKSLMMKTVVSDTDASLRPETATATYLTFKRAHEFFRKKLPFGIFQIGKAFRNEISPRQHVLRSREFTQGEAQLFIDPLLKNDFPAFIHAAQDTLPLWTHNDQDTGKKPQDISLADALKKKYLQTKAYAWCLWLAYQQFIKMGIPRERIRMRQHHPDERAFYADDAWDIEVNLKSFGWIEMCGIHERQDYDLTQHEKFSKQTLQVTREDGSKVVPHILEIAFGPDRMTFALLDIFYEKKTLGEGKTIFAVPYPIAPIDIAIYPLLKRENLPEKALALKAQLEKYFVVEYDESGSIGKRYLRAAEAGTPYCITVDHDTLKNNTVTVRDRDTEKQIRVPVEKLHDTLHQLLNKELLFAKAGKLVA